MERGTEKTKTQIMASKSVPAEVSGGGSAKACYGEDCDKRLDMRHQ